MQVCTDYGRRIEANLRAFNDDGKLERKYAIEGGKWTRTKSAKNIWINEAQTRYYLPSHQLVTGCREGSSELERVISEFEVKYESDSTEAWESWDELQYLMRNIFVIERCKPHYECTCPQGRTGVCKHVIGVYLLENKLKGYNWKEFTLPGGSPEGKPR
ncbi:hypothetical protein Pmar_PMAR018388 [Perkinsus marinus ATCC 50983]|uniref:SWIM-type domain-containing protein n=1 Tax=Perkinsus marinus (strain ATCC 50983 / TXsc) TaxID=423536 RepID=C5LS32_PERM5|nr:hypothetical protein Pmar_PMAR018388 [Perkinsus marinus ATCC 50983]EER00504.1 hypothetical protein Pmar_PMAR018388 [Perkinsus marinus ATCC 50983]|eukprot:XP_002767786.1 hypothetical protein Pmar_PMAR018388 [Perkinsus marinus ATCC 50983]